MCTYIKRHFITFVSMKSIFIIDKLIVASKETEKSLDKIFEKIIKQEFDDSFGGFWKLCR